MITDHQIKIARAEEHRAMEIREDWMSGSLET